MTDAARLALIDAAKLLGRREYSEVEMLGLLASRHPDTSYEPVIQLLRETGMISSGQGTTPRRGIGYEELKARLKKRGLDASSIDLLLESDLATAVEQTKELIRLNLPGEKDPEKVFRFLSFRGVDEVVAKALVERMD
jgi:SOS response regulatory protein OraA/RecX